MKFEQIAILFLGVIVTGLFGFGGANTKSDTGLTGFSYSSGGGMNGGSSSTEVYTLNDEVYLLKSYSSMWYEDNTITEYTVDKAILEEIEAVFNKHGMKKWHNKKFTNDFVYDGESYSYRFYFKDDDDVWFSSQIYPTKYREKLNEIHDIISKYEKDAKPVPGLVKTSKTPEEQIAMQHPDNGIVGIEVYEYSKNYVFYHLYNGTAENVEVPDSVKLVNDKDGQVVYEKNGKYSTTVYANSNNEEQATIDKRLEAGEYTLTVGIYSTTFTIR